MPTVLQGLRESELNNVRLDSSGMCVTMQEFCTAGKPVHIWKSFLQRHMVMGAKGSSFWANAQFFVELSRLVLMRRACVSATGVFLLSAVVRVCWAGGLGM